MVKVKKTTIQRMKRTDDMLWLNQHYTGDLDSPRAYNAAYANVLRKLADKIEKVKNAYVDPEVVVWMQFQGRIEAQVTLSPDE